MTLLLLLLLLPTAEMARGIPPQVLYSATKDTWPSQALLTFMTWKTSSLLW